MATDSMAKPTVRAPAPPQKGSRLWLAVVIAVVCVAGIVWLVKYRQNQALAKSPARGRGDFPTPVVIGTVVRKAVPIYLDGLGTVQAFNTVTIKAQLDGKLMKVAFVEGQDVHTGDLLAEIDPAPYKAAVEQAQGKKKQDEAQLQNARRDLERDAELIKDKIVTEQAYATQQAMVSGLEASVAADQAGVDSAQVQLDYTTISSPIDGRCGIRLVDQGNIVHPTDTNGLVIITQLKPISVVFTLPEQNAGPISAKLAKGLVSVIALDRDNKTVLGKGNLAVIDNQIDSQTGTIKLKATFANDDLQLWPGQFVNARVLLETRNGLVVPASVVQRGPDGEYAFVVKDKVAKVQPIKVAQIEDGMALLQDSEEGGLWPGDQVVVDGQYRLQDGSKVSYGDQKPGGKPGAAPSGAPGQSNKEKSGPKTNDAGT